MEEGQKMNSDLVRFHEEALRSYQERRNDLLEYAPMDLKAAKAHQERLAHVERLVAIYERRKANGWRKK